MKKLYPLSFARDDNVTCLKNSIEISGEIILRAFVEAAIVYSFLSEAASLLWRIYGGRSLCHGYGKVYWYWAIKGLYSCLNFQAESCFNFLSRKIWTCQITPGNRLFYFYVTFKNSISVSNTPRGCIFLLESIFIPSGFYLKSWYRRFWFNFLILSTCI